MQQFVFKGAILTASAMTIMASGGAGTTITDPPPIGGVAYVPSEGGGFATPGPVTVTVDETTGAWTISDGTNTFVDPDGPDEQGRLTDGTFNDDGQLSDATFLAEPTDDPRAGDYEYATAYHLYTETAKSFAIVGEMTPVADMPTDAGKTATYTGESYVYGENGGGVLVSGFGTSKVTADFGSASVEAVMDLTDVSAQQPTFDQQGDQTGYESVTSPFDTVTATGMTIDGNRFSGGSVTTSSGGTQVDFTGDNTTSTVEGAFFGYDSTIAAPDEVGGMFTADGDDGVVQGQFIAD